MNRPYPFADNDNSQVILEDSKDSTSDNQGIVDLLAKALGQNAKVLVLPDGHASLIVAQDFVY
jgi:hypothetical protein